MLLTEFDEEVEAIVNPSAFRQKKDQFPEVCVAFFQRANVKLIMDRFELLKAEAVAELNNSTFAFPVYKLDIDGFEIGVFHAPIGAPAAVSQMEGAIANGVKKLLYVGYCGCLDGDTKEYSIIVPDKAIRDEGTSYHYAPVSDTIDVDKDMVQAIEDTLKNVGIEYKKGTTWTIDAVYRETPKKVQRRKKQGAITVEMECSALCSVAKFRGVKFGQILYSADNLGGEKYDPRIMRSDESRPSDNEKIIGIAFECAKTMKKMSRADK